MTQTRTPSGADERKTGDRTIVDLTVPAPTFTVDLVRPDDQTRLRFEFVDLVLAGDDLVASGPEPAIRVVFGPQHTAEDTIDAKATPKAIAVDSRTAGDTVVVISVQPPIPFDLATLLDLPAWELATGSDSTRIEAPQAIVLQPETGVRLSDTSGSRTHGTVTDLWTARFEPGGVAVVENLEAADPLALRSPAADERDDLVTLTSQVAPVDARRLWLSLHGAFLDLLGEWSDEDTATLGTNVTRWLHRAATGRDLAIEVTTRGFLAPFGHRAAMVTITEREFLPDSDDAVVAVLAQQTFLTITDPVVTFPSLHMPNDGRGLPFSEVRIGSAPGHRVEKQQIEWTDVSGSRSMNLSNAWHVIDEDGDDVAFAFTAIDRTGTNEIAFELPVSFIEYENAFSLRDNAPPSNLTEFLTDDESVDRRTIYCDGAPIAWADEDQAGTGLTTKVTDRILLTMQHLSASDPDNTVTRNDLETAGQPNLFPVVERAWIIDDAIASTQGDVGEPVEVTLHDRWITHGNDEENFDQAYLMLKDSATFSVGGDGRAIVALDLNVKTFSQLTGAGPDLESADDPWDPGEALGDAAELLGSIPLSKLIGTISLDDIAPGLNVPGLEVIHEADGTIIARFTYRPKLHDFESFVDFDDKATATVIIESRVSYNGATPPSAFADIEVTDFALSVPPLLPAVVLFYNRVRAFVPDDGSIDVDYDLDHWELGDLLAWLQPLLDALAEAGASVSVDVTDTAMTVDLGLTPPDIQMGVLSIRNFEIGTTARFPFEGALSIDAGVGREERPVEVSLLGFEGSFYLLIGIGGEDATLQTLAIGAEATVQLFGIDVIVAEATVDLGLAGYFQLDADGTIAFGGSITLEGVLDVLGIVSVSAGIVGSLDYDSGDQDLVIGGRITYAVDTILTKPKEGSIPLGEITYSLGSSNAMARMLGPSRAAAPAAAASLDFGDRFSRADWLEYTGAFA